eukprot:CAMPEP_0172298860 /NCGR_PEP_ID=MMETSP1058-20130122/1319_1 /TAXON_ID=83371 /ORGANISM="Detonula confervacea, Strain CCMP 353" /LENGTH=122 /DNA_ID=CAMNT_0013008155 /DNA_START=44 /DNA_END=412 /DNA_ORIENTATION=-
MKLTALLALVSIASTSAFVAPTRPAAVTSLQATPTQNFERLSNAATVGAVALTTTILASPFAALAVEDDGYEYGAVSAPGGIGLAWGLGIAAILTAAVPVLLSPGEDAFNEMKDKDADKWRK